MIKNVILGLAAVATLSACATTDTSSQSAASRAIVKKAVDQVTSDAADQLGDVSAAQAMDCQMAFGIASAAMKDGTEGSSKLGALMAVGIYGEVHKRRTDPATANLDDLLKQGPLMTAMGDDSVSTEEQVELTVSTMKTCSDDLQVALAKSKALKDAKS